MPSLLSSSNPTLLVTERSFLNTAAFTPVLVRVSSSPAATFTVKCSGSNINSSSEQSEVAGGGLKEVLSGMVSGRVEELMQREENSGLLEGLNSAAHRVERAKMELAEIERQEIEAKLLRNYVERLEGKVSELKECEKHILEARMMVEEAERSLSIDGVLAEDVIMKKSVEEIDNDEERLESVKAALVSALLGMFAGLPISLTHATSSSELILVSAVTFISCALFGITFRYAVRRDLDNLQLKTGIVAAFGFVKGLSKLAAPADLDTENLLSNAFDSSIYVFENLMIFVCAAVGLDICFKMRLLSPFPINKSMSGSDVS